MDANELGRWTRFAAKGGIGRCTAVQDCIAEEAEDLMFLKVRLCLLNERRRGADSDVVRRVWCRTTRSWSSCSSRGTTTSSWCVPTSLLTFSRSHSTRARRDTAKASSAASTARTCTSTAASRSPS